MAAKPVKFTINQGATWGATIVWQDANSVARDLTGFTARMQIRTDYANTSITTSLTTENGKIVLTPASGRIDLKLSATDTTAIPVDLTQTAKPPVTTYVFDLEMVDASAVVTRLIYGTVSVTGEVTR